MVAHNLAKVGVASSNLVIRSEEKGPSEKSGGSFLLYRLALLVGDELLLQSGTGCSPTALKLNSFAILRHSNNFLGVDEGG